MTSFAASAWIQPSYSPVYIPALSSLNLTDDEQGIITRLNMLNYRQRQNMLLGEAYYRGEEVLTSLGIALPPELEGLRVALGWARMAVDPYVERLGIDSFRKGDDLQADKMLTDIWTANGLDSEEPLLYTDSLVMGRAWLTLGTPDNDADDLPDGTPRICAESPLNLTASWDVVTRKPKAALQSYFQDSLRCAALYLPDQTIQLAQDENAMWQIVDRDQHNLGFVPIVRMANRPRTNNRDGASEISNQLMSKIDAASRTILNLTAASEFYSVPQKIILGATEEDFMGPDGTRKSAWETYIGRILALQRDAEGALPEVHQFTPYDPSVFIKVLDWYASQVAGLVGATPQELGLYTDGNPVSSEALQVAEARRDRRTERMHRNFSRAWVETAQMALRIQNNGELPSGYDRVQVDWQDPRAVNFTGYADGFAKLAQEGMIARGSEVALRRMGFTVLERRRIRDEIAKDPVRAILTELGTSIEGKTDRLAAALIAAGQPEQAAGALAQGHQAQVSADQQKAAQDQADAAKATAKAPADKAAAKK